MAVVIKSKDHIKYGQGNEKLRLAFLTSPGCRTVGEGHFSQKRVTTFSFLDTDTQKYPFFAHLHFICIPFPTRHMVKVDYQGVVWTFPVSLVHLLLEREMLRTQCSSSGSGVVGLFCVTWRGRADVRYRLNNTFPLPTSLRRQKLSCLS